MIKRLALKNNLHPELKLKNSEINSDNVSFKYETINEKAIKNISFKIEGNTMAAFVDIAEQVKVQL